MRIAIVDDDKGVLEALVSAVESFGFEALPFQSPELALIALKNKDVYIALVDYQMPTMTGTDFIKKLKVIKPLTRCMVMTANGYRDVILEAMRAGAIDFIRKPFALKDLEDMIMHAVAGLKDFPKLEETERQYMELARTVCKTNKEATERLGCSLSKYCKAKAA